MTPWLTLSQRMNNLNYRLDVELSEVTCLPGRMAAWPQTQAMVGIRLNLRSHLTRLPLPPVVIPPDLMIPWTRI